MLQRIKNICDNFSKNKTILDVLNKITIESLQNSKLNKNQTNETFAKKSKITKNRTFSLISNIIDILVDEDQQFEFMLELMDYIDNKNVFFFTIKHFLTIIKPFFILKKIKKKNISKDKKEKRLKLSERCQLHFNGGNIILQNILKTLIRSKSYSEFEQFLSLLKNSDLEFATVTKLYNDQVAKMKEETKFNNFVCRRTFNNVMNIDDAEIGKLIVKNREKFLFKKERLLQILHKFLTVIFFLFSFFNLIIFKLITICGVWF